MSIFPPTIVIRHKKENLKKCSLRGLEGRKDFYFFCYPLKTSLPSLENYILLTLDAERDLSPADQAFGLLLLDGTWRYSELMKRSLNSDSLIKRRLPAHFQTAYPRRQLDCSEPKSGLASVEALYIAYMLLNRDYSGLLDNYYWKEAFLKKNLNSLQFPEVLI